MSAGDINLFCVISPQICDAVDRWRRRLDVAAKAAQRATIVAEAPVVRRQGFIQVVSVDAWQGRRMTVPDVKRWTKRNIFYATPLDKVHFHANAVAESVAESLWDAGVGIKRFFWDEQIQFGDSVCDALETSNIVTDIAARAVTSAAYLVAKPLYNAGIGIGEGSARILYGKNMEEMLYGASSLGAGISIAMGYVFMVTRLGGATPAASASKSIPPPSPVPANPPRSFSYGVKELNSAGGRSYVPATPPLRRFVPREEIPGTKLMGSSQPIINPPPPESGIVNPLNANVPAKAMSGSPTSVNMPSELSDFGGSSRGGAVPMAPHEVNPQTMVAPFRFEDAGAVAAWLISAGAIAGGEHAVEGGRDSTSGGR